MPGLRAGDADRDACIEKLEAAYADGRITGPEREHRVTRALAAVDLSELAALTGDLEVQESPAARRRAVLQRAGRRNTIALVAAVIVLPLVLAGSCLALVVSSSPTSTTPSAVAEQPALRLHTADGFRALVERTRDRFGSALVVDGAIYPDHARLTVPVAGSSNRLESWYFRDEFSGDPSRSTRFPSQQGNIDLALIDPDLLASQVAQTADAMSVPDATTRYVVLGLDFRATPYYAIYASNEYSEVGYWSFTLDGQPREQHPFEG